MERLTQINPENSRIITPRGFEVTQREKEVFEALANGQSGTNISKSFGIYKSAVADALVRTFDRNKVKIGPLVNLEGQSQIMIDLIRGDKIEVRNVPDSIILTPLQQEIAECIKHGLVAESISKKLNIDITKVYNRQKKLFRKIGANSSHWRATALLNKYEMNQEKNLKAAQEEARKKEEEKTPVLKLPTMRHETNIPVPIEMSYRDLMEEIRITIVSPNRFKVSDLDATAMLFAIRNKKQIRDLAEMYSRMSDEDKLKLLEAIKAENDKQI